MPRDFFDDYGDPENRARARERQLEKLKSRPDHIPGGPPMDEKTRARLARFDLEHEGMIDVGGLVPISQTLARMTHYSVPRQRFSAGDDARGSGNDD